MKTRTIELGSTLISALHCPVFHINEGSFGAAPMNMNTGDALGDMSVLCTHSTRVERLRKLELLSKLLNQLFGSRYFDLRSKALAIECASGSPSAARDCDNQEVNPPADDPLVITKLVLRVTAQYSTYGRCLR